MKQDLQKISYAPMNEEERSKIKKGLYFMPFFALFAGGIFYFMFSMAGTDGFFIWVISAFSALFGGIILWIVRGIVLDLRDNEKKIVQGVITLKKEHYHRNSKAGSKHTYYFYFGKKSMRVEADLYHKFSEGDLAEIHMAKRVYNVIFKTEKLKSGVMMDEVRQHRDESSKSEKKLTKIAIIVFVFLVPIILSAVFMIGAECFYCPTTYPQSITSWQPYTPIQNLSDSVEQKAELILGMLNNSLMDEEEAEIKSLIYDISFEKKSGQLIRYLARKKLFESDTLSALDWLTWKFDEQTRVDRPITIVEMWKRVLYNLISIDALKPAYLFWVNNTKYEDVTTLILFDPSVGYDETKAWFGEKSKEELQQLAKDFIPENAAHHPPGVSQYMKEIWKGDFLLRDYYQKDYDRAQKVYDIQNQN